MSWNDVYPVFTHEMVDCFQENATPEELAELEELHGVAEVFNRQDKPHIGSLSLFWKNVRSSEPDLPQPSRDGMQRARELGLALRFDPWAHYVEPVLTHIPVLREKFPDVAFRVYLAKDLDFLIPDLVAVGCEVFLMKSSSVRHNPGAVWRFLAYGDAGKLVTVTDADRVVDMGADLTRTIAMEQAGLGCWRIPQAVDFNPDGQIRYTPFLGCHSGMRGGLPVRLLLDAFTWTCRRGRMDSKIEFPGLGRIPAAQSGWPDYGFDEWFLATVMYPRVAVSGILSLVPTSARSLFLTLDVEYATWANPNSQLVYFPG